MGFFDSDGLILERTSRTDTRLGSLMNIHYSKPQGFVGRNLCYAILYNGVYYGHIIAGSATRHLPGRHEFLQTTDTDLNSIINNIFFHVEKVNGKYPLREFVPAVIVKWRGRAASDWQYYYNNKVIGFESLVELPRTGECYKRDNWVEVGQTIGYTCKRLPGRGTDTWTGHRVWNTSERKPKRVFVRKWDSSDQQ